MKSLLIILMFVFYVKGVLINNGKVTLYRKSKTDVVNRRSRSTAGCIYGPSNCAEREKEGALCRKG